LPFARRVKLTDPGQVVRHVVAMLALAGCDLVFGTKYLDPESALCGPFGVPELVVFDPVLGAPTDLSVAADGVHGLVYAMYNTTLGPTPVVFDAAHQWWTPDTARYASGALAMLKLKGGHIGATGISVFAWIDHNEQAIPALYELHYTATWSPFVPDVADSSPFDLFSGQEVETDAGSNTSYRYLVEIFEPTLTVTPHKIEILAASPADPHAFKPSGFVEPLNRETSIDVISGALTADHQILVYAASQAGRNEYQLYVTQLVHNEFQVGAPIPSLLVPGKTTDQPWLDPDCSTIWFRRDRVTWVAHKM
jgi:hypothetical protein